MSHNAPAFELVCERLEVESSLSRLEARGTVRIALKQAGLEPRTVSPEQMRVVVDKILPKELETRGMLAGDVIARVLEGLDAISDDRASADSPDAIFRHLAGDV